MRFANINANTSWPDRRKSLVAKELQVSEILVKIIAMNRKQLMHDLRAAKKTIDFALEELARLPEIEPAKDEGIVGTCRWCELPILASDELQRGIHVQCYNDAYKGVREKKTTLKQLEKDGVLDPPRKGGRPRKTLRAAAAEMDAGIAKRRATKKKAGK